MKNLIYTLIFTFICATSVAQIGYKPMNGYYEFNGNLRVSDTLFVKTSALSVTGGNVTLKLDTVGSASSGYYRIIASSSGTMKGSGTATRLAVFGASDSIYSPPQMTFDSANTIISLRSTLDDAQVQIRQADTTLTLTSKSLGVVHGIGANQVIEFGSGATIDFKSGLDTTFSILSDSGFVSIGKGNPIHPIDIDARGTTFLRVDDPAIETGAATATFTNAPVAGDPLTYLKVVFITPAGAVRQGVIPVLKAAP